MRAHIDNDVLYIHPDDIPSYKKTGSIVRNSYFWALKSIAGRTRSDKPWEFEIEVWFALNRMLLSFAEAGYLGTSETQLEFPENHEIPSVIRSVSTWL
jgi:hypothetical protein